MKNQRMANVFAWVDPQYIVEAMPEETRAQAHSKPIRHWLAIAACFFLVVSFGFGALSRGWFDLPLLPGMEDGLKQEEPGESAGGSNSLGGNGNRETGWPAKTESKPNIAVESTVSESVFLLPHWADLSISEQYVELAFGNVRYSSRATELPVEKVGDALSAATLHGYDEYAKKAYTIDGMVYSIQGLSPECAVAVRFDAANDYYVYINAYYQPDTLGDLIHDLNLKENMSFGNISYSYFDRSNQYHGVEFTCGSDDFIWSILLSETDVPAVDDFDSMWLMDTMGISVNIPILGYSNINLGVTQDGYLTTNILDSGKAFYIGKDKTEAFVNYVIEHCEGYSIDTPNSNDNEPVEE